MDVCNRFGYNLLLRTASDDKPLGWMFCVLAIWDLLRQWSVIL